MQDLQPIYDKAVRYLPKMISVRYGFNDYITEMMRDKIPTNVRQDIARALYGEGLHYDDLVDQVRASYKLVSSGNVAKYKLVKAAQ